MSTPPHSVWAEGAGAGACVRSAMKGMSADQDQHRAHIFRLGLVDGEDDDRAVVLQRLAPGVGDGLLDGHRG
jgi:hypothetical protein